MKIKCTECEYLIMHHRSGGIYSSYGRGEYYCEHPVSERLPAKAFGNKARCFVCFGTNERETRPTITTAPRWCPEKGKRNEKNKNGQYC